MVNVWKRSMVFVLSFPMSFLAQNILDTEFTGAVQIVMYNKSMMLHLAVTDLPETTITLYYYKFVGKM